jgi:L-asparagine transporter-like permease
VIRRRAGCRPGACKMPGYPYTNWLAMLALVGAMVAMPLVPGQGAGLVAGVLLLMMTLFAYGLFVRRRLPGPLTPGPEPLEAPADDLLLR